VIDATSFRKRLETRHKELDERLQHIEHDLDKPMNQDIEDRATEREDDEVMESMGNAGLAEMQAIEAALQRLDAGTFGECVECSDMISEQRLDIMPTAVKCIKCM
jgi:RNA polymerase-binding transcription factor DksA